MSKLSNYSDAADVYSKWSRSQFSLPQCSSDNSDRAIYGKSSDGDGRSLSYSSRLVNAISPLHHDLFCSPFWRWFSIQRPILDAAEFPARFISHQKGERPLGPEGGIITMLLVIWAYSYGLNEQGVPLDELESAPSPAEETQAKTEETPTCQVRSPEKLEQMLQQILDLVDYHGIMRRPSMDGVRVLLLLLPLLEEVKPLERLTIHDVALSQVHSLCTLAPSVAESSRSPSFLSDDATARARLFWYAYTQEGLSSGLRGGRFFLHGDDFEAFQRTLSSPSYTGGVHSPPSPTAGPSALPDSQAYANLVSSSALPLQLNAICRRIHSVLTGPKAARRAEEHNLIDAHGMREIWRDLDHCWSEFRAIRHNAASNEDPASRCDTERYACAWQIFIFECHNVIRETLKQYMSASSQSRSRPSSHSSSSSPYMTPDHLQLVATRKCLALLPQVISILQFCLSSTPYSDRSGTFTWDSGLVRDGCFYAGYLTASTDDEVLSPLNAERDEQDFPLGPLTADEGVMVCLAVLSTMRWSYSKSEDREETIRMIWEARKAKRHNQSVVHYPDTGYDATYPQTHAPHASGHSNPRSQEIYTAPNQAILSATPSYLDRSMLPPLTVFTQQAHQRRVESAPATACSQDGHGWPSYTPPGTATSLTTNSTGTGLSARGSPEFSHVLPTFKQQSEDTYYGGNDLDHFTYNVPMTNAHSSEIAPSIPSFRQSPADGHSLGGNANGSSYLPSPAGAVQFHPNTGSMLQVVSGNDYASCPQFGDDCNAGYH
ncbi:hypothetical protein FA15DRAFT_581325 [Coprinopsis marcescibilis]|uniref:Transcription factor domain-containing protein n=1 Tax=Coprinopsis marcescibilis TaxID=230819 RepID=A0A5C3LBI9_COPMA|nr:hypothetical protein FA15DRAFT_581325 [Coprinopsis marcescibilis]